MHATVAYIYTHTNTNVYLRVVELAARFRRMAEAIIGPLVGRLQEVAVGEARALVGVNADIHRLRDKLMWLQAFLREADTRRRAVTDEVTRVWTLQTRDAVFDAEDALDHYHLHVDLSRYPPTFN